MATLGVQISDKKRRFVVPGPGDVIVAWRLEEPPGAVPVRVRAHGGQARNNRRNCLGRRRRI